MGFTLGGYVLLQVVVKFFCNLFTNQLQLFQDFIHGEMDCCKALLAAQLILVLQVKVS